MAQNNVSVALVARSRRRSSDGKLHIDDERPHLTANHVETMHVANPPTPLAAQERNAHRILPGWTVERSKHHYLRPRADEVDVVRAGVQRRDLCAWRAGSHFGDRNCSVATTEPLHVAQPGVHPQNLERARARRPNVVVPRVVHFTRGHDTPLNPRIPDNLEWGRIVMRERMPHSPPVDGDRLQ